MIEVIGCKYCLTVKEIIWYGPYACPKVKNPTRLATIAKHCGAVANVFVAETADIPARLRPGKVLYLSYVCSVVGLSNLFPCFLVCAWHKEFYASSAATNERKRAVWFS